MAAALPAACKVAYKYCGGKGAKKYIGKVVELDSSHNSEVRVWFPHDNTIYRVHKDIVLKHPVNGQTDLPDTVPNNAKVHNDGTHGRAGVQKRTGRASTDAPRKRTQKQPARANGKRQRANNDQNAETSDSDDGWEEEEVSGDEMPRPGRRATLKANLPQKPSALFFFDLIWHKPSTQ